MAIASSRIALLLAAVSLSHAASLTDTLALAARNSEQFLERVSAVTCVETLEQRKFDARNRLLSRHDGQFAYLLLLQITPDRLFSDETREYRGKQGKRPAQPLLNSAGFSTLSLIFHPHLQSSYRFTDQAVDTSGLRHIAFEHIKGQRSPSVLESPNGAIPIEWRGEAWVDPVSGTIARIHALWTGPGQGHALRRLSANVQYAPVVFHSPEETFWLPKSADVEVQTPRSQWRNHHEYTSYNRFSVSTQIRLGEVK
ncbi:MAG: hypothetical protein HY820_35640 [Acidobacteria bacterium]|nr:hypothetical protein [Acidobacteriota bacterium]